MTEVSFDTMIDAAIEALDGFTDFIEEEVEEFLMQVEDYGWVNARS